MRPQAMRPQAMRLQTMRPQAVRLQTMRPQAMAHGPSALEMELRSVRGPDCQFGQRVESHVV